MTRRARSSENRNAVNIEKSCKTLSDSQENCFELRNEREMQSQTHWLKRWFLLWWNQNVSTSSQQHRIKQKWCFMLTFYHLQRFSCWIRKTLNICSQLKIMLRWHIARLKESFTRWHLTRLQDTRDTWIK